MATTYCTSQEAYNSAGSKGTVSTSTWPTTAMVDLFRDEAHSDIENIIGAGVTDVRNTAKKIELSITIQKIWRLWQDRRYRLDQDMLTKRQKNELDAVFNDDELADPMSYIPGNET